MELLNYFKKIYQYQFANVEPTENVNHELLRYYKEIDDKCIGENEDVIIEVLNKTEIDASKKINFFLSKVFHEIYEEYKCTELQLLLFQPFDQLGVGSYWVNNIVAVETGCYEDELANFNGNNSAAAILICADVQKIVLLGRSGLVQAIKQAGEIRNILKNVFKTGIDIKDEVNVNALAHAAGININRILILDVIYLNCLY